MLLVWHYQPDQRFVFPLYPLLLAGLWTELKNVAVALQSTWRKHTLPDRVAAGTFASVLGLLAIFIAASTLIGLFVFLPAVLGAYKSDLEARLPAYQWLAADAPSQANVFAYDDPLIYLYTGRHACNLPVPPRLYVSWRPSRNRPADRRLARVLSEHGLDYWLLTPTDFYRDLHEPGALRMARVARQAPGAREMYRSPAAVIYELAVKRP